MSARGDVIVIGAGQNGLVAAAYLAKAGRRVTVLERRERAGGANALEEFHPGFRADGAFQRTGWLDPALARDIGLGDIALENPASLVGLGPGGPFALPGEIPAASDAIRRHSARDAERWPEFCRLIHRLAGFLQHLYAAPAPRLTSTRAADLLALLSLGGRARGLGRSDMIELLRVLPMSVAELLDDWFETDALKGVLGSRGITGLAQGPRSGGTAFLLLHQQVGAPAGAFAGQRVRGGNAAVSAALVAAAERAGALIRTTAPVSRILVRDGRARGVVLETGEEIAADTVVSTVDPRRTMLGLVDPTELAPEYVRALQHVRCRGVTARVNLALDRLPAFTGVSDDALRGALMLSPSLDHLERAWDAAKHGGVSRAPCLEITMPSLRDPSLAPAGRHVMSVWMQYAPYRLADGEWDAARRDALGDAVLAALSEQAPGLAGAIVARQVLTPRDLEDAYGVTEGNLWHAEMALDQILFMRPVPGWGHHATPIAGLHLGGSGTHPGGGIVGGAGRLVARAIARQKETEQA